MISLLATLSLLAAPSDAAPTSLTGRVRTEDSRVMLQTGEATVLLSGELAGDLRGFPGEEVTVQGALTSPSSFDVVGFAPGVKDDFFTGEVSVTCGNTGCGAGLLVGGRRLTVKGLLDPRLLAALDGATVTIRGHEVPGRRLNATSGYIMVRGTLHTMDFRASVSTELSAGGQILDWATGSIVIASGSRAWDSLHGQNVWVGGRLSSWAQMRSVLTGVSISRPIPGPPFGEIPGTGSDGGGQGR